MIECVGSVIIYIYLFLAKYPYKNINGQGYLFLIFAKKVEWRNRKDEEFKYFPIYILRSFSGVILIGDQDCVRLLDQGAML